MFLQEHPVTLSGSSFEGRILYVHIEAFVSKRDTLKMTSG
jgi:hypothetical protein